MKLTREDFRRTYGELSDDALLEIDPNDLVSDARECLEEELAKRSLNHMEDEPDDDEPGEAGPEESAEPVRSRQPPKPTANLVCIAYLFPTEVGLARGALESADIPCVLPQEGMTSIAGYLDSNYVGGQPVLVPESCLEAATDVLGSILAHANKILVEAWIRDVWNGGKDELAGEFGAGVDPQLRAKLSGLEAVIDETIAEADKAAIHLTLSGTHDGRKVSFDCVVIARIASGRIQDVWAINNAPF